MAPALKSGGKCKVGEHDGLSRRKRILCSLEGVHTTLVALSSMPDLRNRIYLLGHLEQ